jgi:hypothetical protein
MANEITFFDSKLANEFGKDYVKILVALLKNNTVPSRAGLRPYPKVASGKLVQSINYRLQPLANGIQVQLLSEDYLKYVDKGRGKGSYPPIQAIQRWTALKGIPKGAAWGIRQNIYKYGIKPTNVISKTLKIIETSRDDNRKYEQRMVDSIVKQLEKNFNAAQSKFNQGQ